MYISKYSNVVLCLAKFLGQRQCRFFLRNEVGAYLSVRKRMSVYFLRIVYVFKFCYYNIIYLNSFLELISYFLQDFLQLKMVFLCLIRIVVTIGYSDIYFSYISFVKSLYSRQLLIQPKGVLLSMAGNLTNIID